MNSAIAVIANTQLRPATADDFPAILDLNAEFVRFLSPLWAEKLQTLHAAAELSHVIEQDGRVMAFLIAFREGAKYDSVNYQWFCQRYPRFLYVDRIVVSARLRTAGAGSMLYQHVFAHAAANALPVVACEFDVEPPNPGSARFHAKFGFAEVGQQRVGPSQKLVSMQVAKTLI